MIKVLSSFLTLSFALASMTSQASESGMLSLIGESMVEGSEIFSCKKASGHMEFNINSYGNDLESLTPKEKQLYQSGLLQFKKYVDIICSEDKIVTEADCSADAFVRDQKKLKKVTGIERHDGPLTLTDIKPYEIEPLPKKHEHLIALFTDVKDGYIQVCLIK